MANENIVSGKKYKVLQDGIWKIFSFFTKASDVEMNDGSTLEEKISEIESKTHDSKIGIVDNLESTDTNKALSANMGRVMNGKLVQTIFIKSFDSATGTLETVSADQLS